MSNQTKGTTTNLTKLVSWDIDLYESMSDEEDCLVWLSQRDKYLLKNALRQVEWSTRWTSEQGTPQPDKILIAENMAFKLSQEYCVDFCQLFIDCLDDDESGTFQAILDRLSEINADNSTGAGQNQSDLIFGDGNNPTCDKDILFGGIVNVVDRANTNNVDALQILEVLTNVNEWLAQVAGGIFGIEAPVAQSMADWALFIQQSILENYEAQITNEYLETIQCGLFCLAQDNCELTPQMLVDYFFGRLQSQLTFESLLTESLEFLVLGVWQGSEIADAMFLSQFVFRAQFGKWFDNVAFTSIDLDMRLGMNDPDNDWTLLCTDCGWQYISDWLVAEEGWIASQGAPPFDDPRAVWSLGNGWESVDIQSNPTQYYRWDGIQYTMASTFVNDIVMTYDVVKGVVFLGTQAAIIIQAELAAGGFVSQTIIFDDIVNGTGKLISLNVDDDIVEIKLVVRCSSSTVGIGSLTGSGQITDVDITGTGIDPF